MIAVRPPHDIAADLRAAMRHMAGAVSVVTAGRGAERTGLTVTSATSFSMEPPSMLVCVNRSSSAWPVIQAHGHFAVNVLSAGQGHVAERFAGRGNVRGAARYEGAEWVSLGSGALGLRGALATIDCSVDEVLERYSHAIVIGRVLSVAVGSNPVREPLVYSQGRYLALALPAAEVND
jgi:3-hydroxy-9,10-secoandrosta-1,3,5(10)-triene-9,17-dione monooxygenase reductase component